MKLLMSGWMLVAGIDTHSQALLKPLISYQGVLKDGTGNAVPAGNKNIIFRIYDESGTLLWAESQSVAIDANGLFNVALGSGMRTQDVLPPSVTDLSKVFTQIGSSPLDQRYLELQVDDGSSAIAPRQQFLAAPYAFGVANIDHAEGPFLVDGILTASSDADVKGGLKVEQTATVGVLQLPAPPGGDPFKISPGTSSPVTAYMDIGDGPGWVMHMRGTGSNVISFANDGRIGIKQPSPAVELDVNGTIKATSLNVSGTTIGPGVPSVSTSGGIQARGGEPGVFGASNNGYAFHGNGGDNDSGVFSTTDGRVSLYANSAERLIVDASTGLSFINLPHSDTKHSLNYDPDTGLISRDGSSRRFKENIRPLADDFHRLLDAEPKTYTRPGKPDRWEIGYIAEEIHDLGLTRLVAYDKEGRPDGVIYAKVCLYLAQIARDQEHKLLAQQEVIAGLEERLSRLEKQVVESKASKAGLINLNTAAQP